MFFWDEKQNWSIVFLQKIFLFHPDNVNQFRQLTRDHM